MAMDKNKTGRNPQNDVTDRDRKSKGKNDPANEGSHKPGAASGSMKQKDHKDAEGRYSNDSDAGTPKAGAKRGGQTSSPDRTSQRIDDDDDMDDDLDSFPGSPTGTHRDR